MQIFEKKFFKNGYHGYKNIDTLYLSEDARWPIVAIIHRYEFIYSLSFCTKASDLRWPWRSQKVI